MYLYMDRKRQAKILEEVRMSVQQRQQKRRRNRSAGVTRRADIIEPIVKEEPASNKYAHLDTMDKVW